MTKVILAKKKMVEKTKNKQKLEINFITLNIRGLNDPSKVHFLKDYLGAYGVDICFLQETHINSSDYVPINLFLQELLLRLSKWQDLASTCKLDE